MFHSESKENTLFISPPTFPTDPLPLRDGIRVIEIGCGPGAMAREISKRIGNGSVLALDRSAKAIRQAVSGSQAEIETGRLSFR